MDEISVVDYSPDWPALFEQEKARIEAALGDIMDGVLAIEHVGSTAVPGLAAKPIIDILIGVRDLGAGERSVEPIVGLGYEYLGEHGIAGRFYFRKGRPRSHHIHMVERASAMWEETVLFRDYLRGHPKVAREYATLKRKLMVSHKGDRAAYTDAKAPFVEATLAQARATT